MNFSFSMHLSKMIYFVLLLATMFVLVNLTISHETKNHKNCSKLAISNCGRGRQSTRIVGGDVASLGQFPWICRLAYSVGTRKGIEFLCAGSLISELHVLTAAHCLTNRLRRRLRFIRLGENFANTEVDCDRDGTCAPIPQDIRVDKITIHQNFNFFSNTHDIALISLARKAKFNAFVLPICLPRATLFDENFLTGYVQVAGWGKTDSWNSCFPSRLRYVSLPVVDIKKCIGRKPHDGSQYCVGDGKGKDSCGGDSGGPMMKAVTLNGRSRYYLFGIVSQGASTCGEEPAMYTRVPYYMEWILDHLN